MTRHDKAWWKERKNVSSQWVGNDKDKWQDKIRRQTTQYNTTKHNKQQHTTPQQEIKTKHNKTQQNKTQHIATQPSDKTRRQATHYKTKLYNKATRHNTTQHNTTQHNQKTRHDNTTQHNNEKFSPRQEQEDNKLQNNTLQGNMTQHNTTQHSTAQHSQKTTRLCAIISQRVSTSLLIDGNYGILFSFSSRLIRSWFPQYRYPCLASNSVLVVCLVIVTKSWTSLCHYFSTGVNVFVDWWELWHSIFFFIKVN